MEEQKQTQAEQDMNELERKIAERKKEARKLAHRLHHAIVSAKGKGRSHFRYENLDIVHKSSEGSRYHDDMIDEGVTPTELDLKVKYGSELVLDADSLNIMLFDSDNITVHRYVPEKSWLDIANKYISEGHIPEAEARRAKLKEKTEREENLKQEKEAEGIKNIKDNFGLE